MCDDGLTEVDVTSSSVPIMPAQRQHHRSSVQYNATTEPLSLQSVELSAGGANGVVVAKDEEGESGTGRRGSGGSRNNEIRPMSMGKEGTR